MFEHSMTKDNVILMASSHGLMSMRENKMCYQILFTSLLVSTRKEQKTLIIFFFWFVKLEKEKSMLYCF